MKNIKLYYKGELDEKLDEEITEMFESKGWVFVGSGYNFVEETRNLEFEKK